MASTVAAGATRQAQPQSSSSDTWDAIAADFDDSASMASTVEAGPPAATAVAAARAAALTAGDFDDSASMASTTAAGPPATELAGVRRADQDQGQSQGAFRSAWH